MVQAGIDRTRIKACTEGVFSLAVAVEEDESAEVELIIDVAESSDPDDNPGSWGIASRRRVYSRADSATSSVGNMTHLSSVDK
jgi:hypothetical protein